MQRVLTTGSKENDAIAVPGASSPVGYVAHGLARAARGGNFLQLAVGEEPDKAAVG